MLRRYHYSCLALTVLFFFIYSHLITLPTRSNRFLAPATRMGGIRGSLSADVYLSFAEQALQQYRVNETAKETKISHLKRLKSRLRADNRESVFKQEYSFPKISHTNDSLKVEGIALALKSIAGFMKQIAALNEKLKKEKLLELSFWQEQAIAATCQKNMLAIIKSINRAEQLVQQYGSFNEQELKQLFQFLIKTGLIADKEHSVVARALNHLNRHHNAFVPTVVGELNIRTSSDTRLKQRYIYNLTVDRLLPLTYKGFHFNILSKYPIKRIRAARTTSKTKLTIFLTHTNADLDTASSAEASAFLAQVSDGLEVLGGRKDEYDTVYVSFLRGSISRTLSFVLEQIGISPGEVLNWSEDKVREIIYSFTKFNGNRAAQKYSPSSLLTTLQNLLKDIDFDLKSDPASRFFVENNILQKQAIVLLGQMFFNWRENAASLVELFQSPDTSHKITVLLISTRNMEFLHPLLEVYNHIDAPRLKQAIEHIYSSLINQIKLSPEENYFEIRDSHNTTAYFDASGNLRQVTRTDKNKEKIYSPATGYQSEEIKNALLNYFKLNDITDIRIYHYPNDPAMFNEKTNPALSGRFNPEAQPLLLKELFTSKKSLLKIPGLGETLAQAILAKQEEIQKLSDLPNIKGIGDRRYQNIVLWLQKQLFLSYLKNTYEGNRSKITFKGVDETGTTIEELDRRNISYNVETEADHHIVQYLEQLQKQSSLLGYRAHKLPTLSPDIKRSIQSLNRDIQAMKIFGREDLAQVIKNCQRQVKILSESLARLKGDTPGKKLLAADIKKTIRVLRLITEHKIEPLGATATLLTRRLLSEAPLFILSSPDLAKYLLTAIIDDTNLFRSPTTTDIDRAMSLILENIITLNEPDFDYRAYIKKYSQTKSINGKSVAEVLRDEKRKYCEYVSLIDAPAKDFAEWEDYLHTYLKDIITYCNGIMQNHASVRSVCSILQSFTANDSKFLAVVPIENEAELKTILTEEFSRTPTMIMAMIKALALREYQKDKNIEKTLTRILSFFRPAVRQAELEHDVRALLTEWVKHPERNINVLAEAVFKTFEAYGADINQDNIQEILDLKTIVKSSTTVCFMVNTPGVSSRKEEFALPFINFYHHFFTERHIPHHLEKPLSLGVIEKAA